MSLWLCLYPCEIRASLKSLCCIVVRQAEVYRDAHCGFSRLPGGTRHCVLPAPLYLCIFIYMYTSLWSFSRLWKFAQFGSSLRIRESQIILLE